MKYIRIVMSAVSKLTHCTAAQSASYEHANKHSRVIFCIDDRLYNAQFLVCIVYQHVRIFKWIWSLNITTGQQYD